MKKPHFLRLVIPLVVGALLVRSWLSSRPRNVFYGTGEIHELVFSSDGKTLLVTQSNSPHSYAAKELTALHFDRSFTPKWSYHDGEELGKPQFFLSDSRVLVDRGFIRTLDANTGEELHKEGDLRRATISPDGQWLAYTGAYPSDMGCLAPATISQNALLVQSATSQSGSVAQVIKRERRWTNNFSFSPDGQRFVVEIPGRKAPKMAFYDVKTWKRTYTWPDVDPNETWQIIQWSRDGRFLLSAYNTPSTKGPQAIVHLWRVRDGQLISSITVPGGEEPYSSATVIRGTINIYPSFEVQNDGRLLSFGMDDTVSLSNTTDLSAGFKPILSLPAERITTATLSPDGSYLVAGTKSGQVVWKQVKQSSSISKTSSTAIR